MLRFRFSRNEAVAQARPPHVACSVYAWELRLEFFFLVCGVGVDVSGSEFRVQVVDFGVWGSGGWGMGFGDSSLGIWFWGFGFEVSAFGVQVSGNGVAPACPLPS